MQEWQYFNFLLINLAVFYIRGNKKVKNIFSKMQKFDDDSTVSSILSGPETRSLGLNALGTT